jgi:hypothetical protein
MGRLDDRFSVITGGAAGIGFWAISESLMRASVCEIISSKLSMALRISNQRHVTKMAK